MTTPDLADALRPLDRAVRLARSVAAALVCVAVAAVGHGSAGGALPAATVLTVFMGAAAVAWLLSARRVTRGQLVGLLVLCQACVHLSASSSDMTMWAGMIAAHAAATAVSAVLLARGEAFIWQLAERLGLRLAPLLLDVVTPPTSRLRTPVIVPRVRHDVRLAYSQALRGPPSGLI